MDEFSPFSHWGVDDYTLGFLVILGTALMVAYLGRKCRQNVCKHENAHVIQGGWHCPDCGKVHLDKN